MTPQQIEEKINQIYIEFGKTIKTGEPDAEIVSRAKPWFKWRLYKESDNDELVDKLATELANKVAQSREINKNAMNDNKVWMVTGNTYSQVDPNFEISEKLSPGIYNLELTMFGWKLAKFAEKFVFPYKLYDLENAFVDHVMKTYHNTNGNLGILFNGIKGTGKIMLNLIG